MKSLIHADIFFFVTTIIAILIGIFIIAVLVYIIRILRDVKKVSKTVKEGTEVIAEDLKNFQGVLKEEGGQLRGLFKFLTSFFVRTARRTKKTKKE